MSRIVTRPTRPGPLTRLALREAQRKIVKLTGREPERMIEPLEAYAHSPALLFDYGAPELAAERAEHVEHRLKELTALKAATIVEWEYCIDIGSSVARRAGISDGSRFNAAFDIGAAGFSQGLMCAIPDAGAASAVTAGAATEGAREPLPATG